MLLAVDTSTRWIGLALYDGVDVIAEMIWQTRDHHTIELAPAVAELFERCGVPRKTLKAIGVALGPGSFTSLRIGLALVKGMALGLHLPLFGVPSLDVLAITQPVRDLPLLAVLTAGRGRLAVRQYTVKKGGWHPQGEIEVLTPQTLIAQVTRPTLVCGELSAQARQLMLDVPNIRLCSPAQSLRRPSYLAEISWKRWQAKQMDDPVSLAPIYVHVGEPVPE